MIMGRRVILLHFRLSDRRKSANTQFCRFPNIPTNSTSNSVSPRYRLTDLGLKYYLYCSGLGTVKMYERVKV